MIVLREKKKDKQNNPALLVLQITSGVLEITCQIKKNSQII